MGHLGWVFRHRGCGGRGPGAGQGWLRPSGAGPGPSTQQVLDG